MNKLFSEDICWCIDRFNADHRDIFNAVLKELEELFIEKCCMEQNIRWEYIHNEMFMNIYNSAYNLRCEEHNFQHISQCNCYTMILGCKFCHIEAPY